MRHAMKFLHLTLVAAAILAMCGGLALAGPI
jgi:hypothetical protein